jgi:hypothetical protein
LNTVAYLALMCTDAMQTHIRRRRSGETSPTHTGRNTPTSRLPWSAAAGVVSLTPCRFRHTIRRDLAPRQRLLISRPSVSVVARRSCRLADDEPHYMRGFRLHNRKRNLGIEGPSIALSALAPLRSPALPLLDCTTSKSLLYPFPSARKQLCADLPTISAGMGEDPARRGILSRRRLPWLRRPPRRSPWSLSGPDSNGGQARHPPAFVGPWRVAPSSRNHCR